jgi:hypothetical protein
MHEKNYLISVKGGIIIFDKTDGSSNGDGAELDTGDFSTQPLNSNMLAKAASIGDLMIKLRGSWDYAFKVDGIPVQQLVLVNAWEINYMDFDALRAGGMPVFTDAVPLNKIIYNSGDEHA